MRYELNDYEWRVIEPMLPNKPRGVPQVDDRRVFNGIFDADWIRQSERCAGLPLDRDEDARLGFSQPKDSRAK